jgi:2-polyprenyl-6-methoxyphenol hydroxylase-like FAD-dependent oxidoreductase
VKWSVVVTADGDRVLTREEIVELADAVAPLSGVASGIGTTSYGARLVVEADGRDSAVARAVEAFSAAAAVAGLPTWPATAVDVAGEGDDDLEGGAL